MRMCLMQKWYRSPHYFLLLAPLTLLFAAIVKMRRMLYHWHFFSSVSLPTKVVVVGNLEIGGSGKTPFVIALVQSLKASGLKVGIISRGYGRASTEVVQVKSAMPISDVGDEALLISRATACPVFVGHSRVDAARTLLKHYECDVIVSDDGLQHYALDRDINIALEYVHPDYRNHWLLPVGPYRESRARFEAMDFHLKHGVGHHDIIFAFGHPYALKTNKKMDWGQFPKSDLYVLAGIAKPERFYHMLNDRGLSFSPLPIKDHGVLSSYQLRNVPDNALIIMTEKDAVKYPKPELIFGEREIVVIPYVAQIEPKLLDEIKLSISNAVPA